MTTNTFLFANNAATILAAPIGPTATSLTVQTGTGGVFPVPNGNEIFSLSLKDALTGETFEIVYCTSHASGSDTFNGLLRGQEGTTAENWVAGDTCAQWITAGQQAAMLQRVQLQANLNIFVNGSTGSDSNNGLASTSAFATWNHAWNYALENYDLNGFELIFRQAGTNTDTLSASGSPIGAITTNSVILSIAGTWSVTNGSCIIANNASFTVQGAGSMSASGTGIGQGYVIAAFSGAEIDFQVVTLGACGNSHLFATSNGQISAIGEYVITGGGQTHMAATFGGSIQVAFETVTLTGTPTFSTAFAFASDCGTINAGGINFNGSATGPRYVSQYASSIDTAGGGANYFPGNSAGTATTGYYR